MKTVLVINHAAMGHGDDELGTRILLALLNKAAGALDGLETVVFYNGGVKLLTDGSPVLQALAGLDAAGVDLIGCGTCIDHFDLRDRIRVGEIAGMDDILRAMNGAERVITI